MLWVIFWVLGWYWLQCCCDLRGLLNAVGEGVDGVGDGFWGWC